MGIFRDEMRKGRAVLHRTMGDGAIIFAWPPEEDANGDPIPPELIKIKVRVHEKYMTLGDLKGTNYHYAEVEDDSPIAVFWLDDPAGFKPERGMYFLTEYGRGYRIDSTFPPDDQTQNAKVIELFQLDMNGWPVYPE